MAGRTRATTGNRRVRKEARVKPQLADTNPVTAQVRAGRIGNTDYNTSYKNRLTAHEGLTGAHAQIVYARGALSDADGIVDSKDSNYLTDEQKKEHADKIEEAKEKVDEHYPDFVTAHERMRDIEKANNVPKPQRLARTDMFGKMYGKHGIHNIQDRSHISQHDQMSSIKGPITNYKGGRRKKTRKKRRRKNKRKTKRRKKTRRRKKRRKKRRTKRR
tara:strand:- start:4 stop:654 length:651 start_codon:yes stop_codon:yes gene_type:complete